MNFRLGQSVHFRLGDRHHKGQVWALAPDRDGYWVATDDGVLLTHASRMTPITTSHGTQLTMEGTA